MKFVWLLKINDTSKRLLVLFQILCLNVLMAIYLFSFFSCWLSETLPYLNTVKDNHVSYQFISFCSGLPHQYLFHIKDWTPSSSLLQGAQC